MKSKKIMINLLCVFFITMQSSVLAAGAMDSEPGTSLPTGIGDTPYAPGQQVQQEEQEEQEESNTPKPSTGVSEEATSVDPIVDPDFYKPTDKGGNDELIDLGNVIIGALQLFGTIAAVITIMVIGIRYMFASVAERASYKETMVPYLIGAIMLFAIPNILKVINDLIKGLNL